jgi:3-oxoacyl-[acyl-carrier protein] reductase
MKLKNKIAIITGGSRGTVTAICRAYAKEGATIVIVNKNNPKNAIEVAKQIRQDGELAQAIACDISNPDAVKDLVQQVIKQYHHIDILANNAGVLIFKNFEDETLDDWNFTIDTNLKGAFLLSQAFVPHMKKQHYGKIIFNKN